jgi:hypothetical protein
LGRIDFHSRVAALEEGDDPHVIEVRMEDQEFCNLLLVNAEFFELVKQIRHDVAHASAYDHGSFLPLEKIDP